jgi:Cu+-exporting ATPase
MAGQGMVFSLGINNANRAGDGPVYGSPAYMAIHGALAVSSMAVMALLGGPLLRELWQALRRRRLSVEALFFISGLGALAGSVLSSWRGMGSLYYEVVAIVLCVYAIGKQVGAVQRGRLGTALAGFRETFDHARVVGPGGVISQVEVNRLRETDFVRVGPGEPVPIDGRIEEGGGYVRETALTGEPTPVSRNSGDRLRAGTWSVDGTFLVRPDLAAPRALDDLMHLLEQAPQRPSRLQELADRLMQGFVPLTCAVSVATFVGWWWGAGLFWEGLFNSMAVLLVACPCALGLAMPAGLWAGLYYLSQHGLVGRHGRLLDILAHADTIVFDKTGTLTEFEEVADTSHLEEDPDGVFLKRAIASIAQSTRHPVSEALSRLSDERLEATAVQVHPGRGLEGKVMGRHLLIGEADLLRDAGVNLRPFPSSLSGKPVHLAVDGCHKGFIVLQERLRSESMATLEALRDLGCVCHILSGDPHPSMDRLASVPIQGGLSAGQKAASVRRLQEAGKHVVFVGDGVNDIEAMQAAEAALAIEAGAALASESADGLLVGGRIGTLPFAIRKARSIRGHLTSNLRFALAYNLIGMILAAAGLLHPVVAALLMVGSSVLVSYRALRAAAVA